MEYNIKNKPKSEKEIEVTLSSDEIVKYFEVAARKISSEIKIKGFRPGKAPMNIVKDIVGEKKIWNEASFEAINVTYSEIIKKEKIDVISSPEVEIIKMEVNKPLTYKITFAVFPEIVLPDYKEIAKNILKNRQEVDVSSIEIEEAINAIKNSRAKIVRVFREAKNGDEVIFNFQGKIDGDVQEGLKKEEIGIILGETRFIDGFAEQIIGQKEGEKKSFTLKVPFSEGPQKEVEFAVEILAVNERELPIINDEFAKSLGNFSDLEDLKNKIKENIKREKENKARERTRIKIIEGISQDSSVEIPDILIKKEAERMMNNFKNHLSERKESFEKYLERSGKKEEEITGEWKEQAKKSILASLILKEIVKQEKIEVSQEELEKEVTAYRASIENKDREKIDINQLKVYIRDIIENNKAFQVLENL